MRGSLISILAILQSAWHLYPAWAAPYDEHFNEKLTLKSLPDGKLLAHFDFITHVDATIAPGSQLLDYNLFPKVIGQVLQQFGVREMHLTFSQGRWNYDSWGYPPEQSAGTGVELWAWMQDSTDVDARWKSLTNTLSGLFCASLNFIDETLTTQPALSFDSNETMANQRLRFGYLPHENVCTENLTPWIKLLPCKAKSGIATLLNAHKIYNSNFHSMSIHAQLQCKHGHCRMELKQAVISVMDPVRDTNRRDWSLEEVFGRAPHGACPVADQSVIHVANVDGATAHLTPEPTIRESQVSTYDLKQANGSVNIRMAWPESSFNYPHAPVLPIISAHRYLTGHGQERGGLQVTIQNRYHESLPIIYYDSIPWFLKLYLHTLQIDVLSSDMLSSGSKDVTVEQMLYQPAVDRARPSVLECKLLLPANSTVTLSMDLDKVFLKYTEHRPDANRGFDIGSAIITAPIPDESRTMRFYTDTLLVSLPTPDFSMPYNVITLTCTVIALFFGSIFNLLTRRFQILKK